MPQVAPRIYPDGTELYVWQLDEPVMELEQAVQRYGIDTSPFRNYKSETRRRECLAEAILLAEVFGAGTALRHRDNGAPYIAGSTRHISISHTLGVVAIAVSESREIGLDIEYASDRVMRVREKFLNEEERQHIAADSVAENLTAWTAKEAAYKLASHDGLSMKNDIRIEPFSIQAGGAVEYEGVLAIGEDRRRIRFVTTMINDMVITIATENKR